MKSFSIIFLFSLLLTTSLHSQSKIDSVLKVLNRSSVAYVYNNDFPKNESILLLDTREEKEFEVSHLKNAIGVGYKNFKINKVKKLIPNKNAPIIVYCSIGVRSEDIGERLLKNGYTNVRNLYGGIFEWKNNNLPVYNTKNNKTQKIHGYNHEWGKLLIKGKKVYN